MAMPALLTSASSRPKRFAISSIAFVAVFGIGHVAGNSQRHVGLADRRKSALQILAVDIEQRDAPAVGEKSLGGRKPDAARRAGHQCNLVCGFAHRFPLHPHAPVNAVLPGCVKDAAAPHKATSARLLASAPVLRDSLTNK